MIYQEYLRIQAVRAKSKWGRKWTYDEIFKQLLHFTIDEVDEFIKDSKEICCMGCRAGTEVFEFKERYPKAQVYGVDIAENIESIRTHLDVRIELKDFNKLPDEWENKFDLVFSNSLDHAFDVCETIKEWHRVARGYLLLELSTTPSNNIEHSFKFKDIAKLFPASMFKKIMAWESPDRDIFTVFVGVK